MNLFDAIFGLRATRVYDDRPLPRPVLDRILTAATRACSSGNTQPWELVVVTDRDVKKQLKAMLAGAFASVDVPLEDVAHLDDWNVPYVREEVTP